MKHTTWPGLQTTRTFLHRYWQKSPHLIRNAFPDFKLSITTDALKGLACTASVESRVILKIRKRPGWQVRHGPFRPGDFSKMPKKNWTLLVHDVDKHVPEFADFLQYFRFIPNWRIDDLMISYAADGGSVGPHVDAYDVFLLQAQGQRRWCINQKPQIPVTEQNLDLKLVHAFNPEHTWLLKTGDMLYLPPGVSHHGVAEGPCITLSIGFRSPTDAEMLADLSNLQVKRLDKESRYSDIDLKSASVDPGLITQKARVVIRQRLRMAQHLTNDEIDEWFGCFVTEPKPWLIPRPARRSLTMNGLKARLAQQNKLVRDPSVLLSWYGTATGQVKLFVNGHCYNLPARASKFARLLCKQRTYARPELDLWLANHRILRLLTELYNEGIVYFP